MGRRTTPAGTAKADSNSPVPSDRWLPPNITSHPTKGIGAWTDADIKRALTQGVERDGRAFKPPMARQNYFSKMTDDDVNAIVAWVRTIPPLE